METAGAAVFGDATHRANFIARLRVGVQYDADVTGNVLLGGGGLGASDLPPVPLEPAQRRLATQVWCSAVAVGYSRAPIRLWKPLATAVLEGTYEATLLVGVINDCRRRERRRQQHHLAAGRDAKRDAASATASPSPSVLLTLVGGGVFGNQPPWIAGAIRHAVAAVEAGGYRAPPDAATLRAAVVHYGGVDPSYARALPERLS